jgi:D-cysteine desulfhydrase
LRLGIDLDRVALGEGPTPVRELGRLGERRGRAPLWLKDDGAYAAHGGNKARKLEWLFADARRRGRRTILSGGATASNHALACATFGAQLGFRVVLVLAPQPEDDHVRRQLRRLRESGAELHRAGGDRRALALAASLMLRRVGPGLRLPYPIGPGGSSPLGCVGYAEAGLELGEQVREGVIPEPSHVVVALGSGGTAAGLLLGLKLAGLRSRLVAVLVQDSLPMGAGRVARLARATARLLSRHGASLPPLSLGAGELDVERGWLGDGYGHSTAAGQRAIELFGEHEGVALEPVYTAKAVAALLELNRRGAFGDGPVLYWHTYDTSS